MSAFCKYVEVAQLLNKKHRMNTKFILFTDATAVRNYVITHCNSSNLEYFHTDSHHIDENKGENCSNGAISQTMKQWYEMSRCSLHVNSKSGFSMSAALVSNSPLAVVRNINTYVMYPGALSAPLYYL
jgi:hypothetical protein